MLGLRFFGALCVSMLFAAGCGSSNDTTGSSSGGHAGTGGKGGTSGTGGSAGAAGSAGGPLALAAGEAVELTVTDGKTGTHLATPNGDEQFILILASSLLSNSSDLDDYTITSDAPSADAAVTKLDGCTLTSDAWAKLPLQNETPPSGTSAAQGDKKTLSVETPSGAQTIDVQAVAVGKSAVVWSDITTAHPANMDPVVVQDFLTDFENIILPRARTIFGVESDLDKDGHIGLVFTPLTYDTAVAFFTSCDLKPGLGCGGSNSGEYLYITPPNTIAPPYNTPKAIKEILAHELSHLIHFNRKVLLNNLANWFDSAYMGEGVGGFSQDVTGYQAGNFYVTMAGLDGINDMSLSDTLMNNAQYDQVRDGVLRGGSYLFVRWFYDHAGGDKANADGTLSSLGGPALLRKVLDSPDPIATDLPVETNAKIEDMAMDYWTTLAMSNRDQAGGVAPKNSCFSYLPTVTDPITGRTRGANLFGSFGGTSMTGVKLQKLADADAVIRAGGAEFIEIDASAGTTELTFNLTADVAALPRLRVARIH